MTTLPLGVTLRPIDGGPNYYTDNGFTNAVSNGWDNGLIPIGLWIPPMLTQADANRWIDLGLNTTFALTGNSNLSLLRANHISAVLQSNEQSRFSPGTETVGWMTADEGQVSDSQNAIGTTPNSLQDHHFWWINNTWNFIEYGDLSGVPGPQFLSMPFSTPNGTTRHIDEQSVDIYWFAGAEASFWRSAGGQIYNLGRSMTPDEMSRGSNYGDMIDSLRAYQTGHFPAPIAAFIEDGGPYIENTSASNYITPPELNWAVWSSLIHGARNIVYFNHSFAGPAQSNDNLAQSYYHTVQPGQTISIYDQVKATDALVQQMAPVLASPFALGYVHVNGGYNDLAPDHTLGGIETAAHYYNGNFYIFADTRESESQHNIAATYLLNDPNAASVTVLNENRTISVINGSFSDTFANASTVHIYQVNDGPGAPPPPPGAPSAPVISAFSPDTAPVSDGHTTASVLTLTGIGVAGTTINVVDGSSGVGSTLVDSTGHWSLATGTLAVGAHSFSATDSNAYGTSPPSATLAVTIDSSTTPPPSTNLVVNGGFETGNFTGWTTSGNVALSVWGPQLFITPSAHSGQDAAGFGSIGSDGTISQNLTTVVGQSYTLDFWLANMAGGPNDFTAKIGGVTELHLVDAAAQPYTHYNYTFTATSTSTPLEFDFRQDPLEWHLDDVSVTGVALSSLFT